MYKGCHRSSVDLTEFSLIQSPDLKAKALRLIHNSQYRDALPLLKFLSREEHHRAFAFSAMGACLYKLLRPRSAERILRKGLLYAPSHLPSHLNLANALVDQGKYPEALTHYRFLAGKEPTSFTYQLHLCFCLIKLSLIDQAHKIFGLVAELFATQDLAAQLLFAKLLAGTALNHRIQPLLAEIVKQNPDCAEANFYQAMCLRECDQHEKALHYACRAIELDKSNSVYNQLLALIYIDRSSPGQAIPLFEHLLKLTPHHPIYLLTYHLLTPVVAGSKQEMHFYWSRCLAGLRLLLAHPYSFEISPYLIQPHLFFLAYHRQNLRHPMKAYADLLYSWYGLSETKSCRTQKPMDPCKATSYSYASPAAAPKRVRIGIASEYFSEHSNSRAFEGLIQNLDKQAFELFLIHGPRSRVDETSRRLDSVAHASVRIQDIKGNHPDCNQLRDLNLDILYYTDLGMNTEMNYMAMQRLAPIQMTGWGIPHTSGIRNIDYYLSSELAEPEDGENHYVESLVRLPGLPCCYLSERLELIEVPREYFFLPPDVPVFGCLQSLYKLHPDFDLALEQLAIANPDAAFVFVESPRANITKLFLERVKRSAPHFHDQLVFLALMHRLEFISLSNVVDVLLDPFYYCSGITFYESTFVGTPTVTMEGKFLRSRFVAAAYRLMGIDNPPVAHSPAEYVALASRLIQNRDELASLRRELRQKAAERLYDDLAYVRGFEAFCQEAVVRHGLRQAAAA